MLSQIKTKKFSKEYENYFQSLKKSFFDGEKKKTRNIKLNYVKLFLKQENVLMDLNVDLHMEKKNYQKKLYAIIIKKNHAKHFLN
jgi:hypothetical protein